MMPFRPSSETAPDGGWDRREFILGGFKVTLAFLAAGALPRPARAESWTLRAGHGRLREARIDQIPVLDDSLQVIAAYLARYEPPRGNFPAAGPWIAAYDLIEWDGSAIGASFYRRNRVIGGTVLTRLLDGEEYRYEALQTVRMQGFESTLKSSARCVRAEVPHLRAWRTRYESRREGQTAVVSAIEEQGWHDRGILEIASEAGVRRVETERPVLPQFALLDGLRGARADRAVPSIAADFDLLHDLTSYRPRQRVEPYGVLDIRLNDRRHRLHGFVQTGVGTEPTHIWIDEAGRPLLVTAGLLSRALVSVEPA